MRVTGYLLPLVGLLLGCGGRTPSTTPPVMPRETADRTEASTPEVLTEDPAIVAGQVEKQRDQLLNESDPLVRREAALVLTQLGPEGWAELVRGLDNESAAVRLACLQAFSGPLLAGEQGDQVRPILARLLRDRDALIRREAALRLGWSGPRARSHQAALQQTAKSDSDAEVRRVAATSVAACQETAGQVAALLRDPNPLIREQAIARLIRFSHQDVVPWLGKLRELADADPEETIRQAAESALDSISSREDSAAK